ncbi:macro domain-containing protein [Bremerella sp.]|uniref:macro domain-containing protein n=1 Tax=Bremerella sp. TaxID=2795602 RepID=UPI003918CBA2
MPITYCRGDIFETDTDVALAHGCNCAGAMGKGIAVAFKQHWPDMYRAYKAKCGSGEFTPGKVFPWKDEGAGRTIYNLGTQRTWRTQATLEAIEQAVTTMLRLAQENTIPTIAMPLIGAGLGGLAADDVKVVLDRLAGESSVRLIVCEEFVPGRAPEPSEA